MATLTYPLPRSYPVTTQFGMMAALGGQRHYATDFGAPFGTPVLAAGAGVVIESGWNIGGGNEIKIDHGGFVTQYDHLALKMVVKGQQVRAGQQIGTVGSTGALVTGAHLHFALRIDGTAESDPKNNPMLYLGGGSTLPAATLTGGEAPEGSPWCYPSALESIHGVKGHPPAADGSCPVGWTKRGYASNLAPPDSAGALGGLLGMAIPPLLEPALNIGVVLGGLFLVYKGVRTMLS